MGNDEAGTPPKSKKASSPIQEQTNVHAYPDWAAIQAYYGPGVSLPPPYFGSPVASGHAPHPYMWGPQPMMPPYGTPYAAIYSHGGVYAHPSMPMGAHPHGHGIASSATTSDSVMPTPLSIDTPAKPSGNKDGGLMKKLKSFDGFAVSIGNGTADNAAGSTGRSTQSLEGGTEGSSDGSDGDVGNQTSRKRSCEDMAATGKHVNANGNKNAYGGDTNAASTRALGVTTAQVGVAGKPLGSVPSSGVTPGMDFSASATGKSKSSVANVPPAPVPAREGLSCELWTQDERELKRERRKQSNRESARRSRLRKQAESEELAMRVESLNVENMALRTEINRLSENSERLRRENSALMEKLKNAPLGQGEKATDKTETQGAAPIGIKDLLARVNNSSRSGQQESESHDNSSGKLHQLLESNPRADAVAAG